MLRNWRVTYEGKHVYIDTPTKRIGPVFFRLKKPLVAVDLTNKEYVLTKKHQKNQIVKTPRQYRNLRRLEEFM